MSRDSLNSESYSSHNPLPYSADNPIQDYSVSQNTAVKKSLHQKFTETSTLGEEFSRWLEDEGAQRSYVVKHGVTAAEDMNPVKPKRGKIILIAFVAFVLLSIFGAMMHMQYRYIQGECRWATWTEYDKVKEQYVSAWQCIDHDDPRLDDPEFAEKVEFKNPWDWLKKTAPKEPTQK